MVAPEAHALTLLGHVVTSETVLAIIQKASAVKWGTHLRRWRYFDVTYEGRTYDHNTLIPTSLWHLLKRVYVDQDWPEGTREAHLREDARATIQASSTKIFAYGYHRTNPPRLQWGFFNSETGIAVVYDMEADLIATVFKPEEGMAFFECQMDAVQIDRKEWGV